MLAKQHNNPAREVPPPPPEEERLRAQVKNLFHQLDTLEQEFQSKEQTLKQTVGLLTVLSKAAVDQEIASLLDQIGRELKKGVHPPTLERLLAEIKERVAREEPRLDKPNTQVTPLEEPRRSLRVWPATAEPSLPGKASQPVPPVSVRKQTVGLGVSVVQQQNTEQGGQGLRPVIPSPIATGEGESTAPVCTLLNLVLDQLQIDGQAGWGEQLGKTRAIVNQGSLLQHLPEVQQHLTDLLLSYRKIHVEERTRLEDLLKDFIGKLAEIEKNVVHGLFENHKQVMSENAQFADQLEGQATGMREAAQLKDLEAIRNAVASQAERMRAAIQTKRAADAERAAAFAAKVDVLEQQLQSAHQQLSCMTERAYHDPLLAGVYNRAAFHERLTQEILRFARYHRAVSLILFDLDYFKRINDTHGHQVGDSTLKTLAARVQVALRAPDFFARFGGDEFALILPDTSLSGAVLLAERLSRLVANTRFPYETHELYVSLSLGVATIHSDDTVETVLERADRALYLAKERGRNQVRSEEELPPPPASTLDKVKRFLPRNWGLQRRTKEE